MTSRTVPSSSTFEQQRQIIETISSDVNTVGVDVGDKTTLTTTNKTNLVAAINELKTSIDNITAMIGTLGSLTTTDKTNLVNAINEIKGLI